MSKSRKKADQNVDKRAKTLRPRKAQDVPVTQRMLYEVRSELSVRINSVNSELKGEMTSLRNELRGEMTSLRNELKDEMTSLSNKVVGEIHSLALLVEEQNARNKFVLDGYASLHDRQAHLEQEFANFKKANPSA